MRLGARLAETLQLTTGPAEPFYPEPFHSEPCDVKSCTSELSNCSAPA